MFKIIYRHIYSDQWELDTEEPAGFDTEQEAIDWLPNLYIKTGGVWTNQQSGTQIMITDLWDVEEK